MSNGIQPKSFTDKLILFFLQNKLVTFLWLSFIILFGFYVMPFEYGGKNFRSPISVDAIPDIGEKQVIVFADWPGRSPQDIQNQVTYPLTITLQGIPGVKSVRSFSMFGFSTCYVIFRDDIEFYWARSRVLERLSIAQQRLPEGVIPYLGPDATGLGQIFWYTVEGKGFDLPELRSIQDWYVRYALQSVEGVSEVASIGGYVKEYQVDVDPDAMRQYGVGLGEVFSAVESSNIDIGAETIEFNGVEYIVRGKGFLKEVSDIENTVIKENENTPIFIKNIGHVSTGPALRRGILDREGSEVVGGVVTCRYGANPLEVINRVKEKIKDIEPGLPQKSLRNGLSSQVKIVPFYDRTKLIRETLFTLEDALLLEVIITCFVIFLILNELLSSFIISINLPLAILLSFGLMKVFGVQSNLMSLGGIAIAIGTMVDMGILLCENTVRHLEAAKPEEDSLNVVFRASSEIGSAVVTAIATTIVGFLPVFALTGPEGKLFKPLAYTKTFALFASVIMALTVIPTLSHLLLARRNWGKRARTVGPIVLIILGILGWVIINPWLGIPLLFAGGYFLVIHYLVPPTIPKRRISFITGSLASFYVLLLLTRRWMPLGLGTGFGKNFLMVLLPTALWGFLALLMISFYPRILHGFLKKKLIFLSVPILVTILGLVIFLGFGRVTSPLAFTLKKVGLPEERIKTTRLWTYAQHKFPGLGREFMPALDEGSFLFMPVTMPHASVGQAYEIIQKQDILIKQIPEIESVVGKLGRAETALDPAPINMIETFITYRPEYGPLDPRTGKRERLWRKHIKTPDDIWNEIVKSAEVPGSTSAPKLMPIAARIVMLQSGMRAPMGVKVFGNSLQEVEDVGYKIARFLQEVPSVNPDAVIPDRIIAKPYLEIEIDREKSARYGVGIRDVQEIIEIAVGGRPITQTVEGRERYPVRVRYLRELRDSPEELQNILVPSRDGSQIPLGQLAKMDYVSGPQEIKSESTFLVSYVLFDKKPAYAEVNVVEECKRYLQNKIESGELVLPPGTYYTFAGTYENQINFQRRISVILPLSLFLIFLILYFQFHSSALTFIVFLQLFCVWSGGVVGFWLVGQSWFLNFAFFGANLRELFHLKVYFLSVPVWVGFIALFGIATDDAVVINTYLVQQFAGKRLTSISEVRSLTVEAAKKRARPCFMTTITTVLALYPILTSMGKGSEVMTPMTIPILSGMTFELITFYITPVLFCFLKEKEVRKKLTQS